MKDADFQGYFTNQRTHRTGGTRLFQVGIDRKLVKEATGHTSDAVDKYQVMSHEQCREMSKILAGNTLCSTVSVPPSDPPKTREKNCDNMVNVRVDDAKNVKSVETQSSKVGEIISQIIEKTSKKGKTTIKIEIEISHE